MRLEDIRQHSGQVGANIFTPTIIIYFLCHQGHHGAGVDHGGQGEDLARAGLVPQVQAGPLHERSLLLIKHQTPGSKMGLNLVFSSIISCFSFLFKMSFRI